jgi:hypothetical protein
VIYNTKVMFMELRVKDLIEFYGCSDKTARMRCREIKTYFNLRGRITLWHLSQYESIPIGDLKLILFGV